jgi:hypothetical protein
MKLYRVVTKTANAPLLITAERLTVGKESLGFRHRGDRDPEAGPGQRLNPQDVSGRCGSSREEHASGGTYRREVRLVGFNQVEIEMHHVLRGGAGGQQNRLKIVKRLGGLGAEIGGTHDGTGVVHPDLAGDINSLADLDGLAESLETTHSGGGDELLGFEVGYLPGRWAHRAAARLGTTAGDQEGEEGEGREVQSG